MEDKKKNLLSLQLDVKDFIPASADEKQSLVIMRESVGFWKDGIRRFRKNKIAMTSLIIVLLIVFICFIGFFYLFLKLIFLIFQNHFFII